MTHCQQPLLPLQPDFTIALIWATVAFIELGIRLTSIERGGRPLSRYLFPT